MMQIDSHTPLIVTGHAFGGSIALLFTLWLLDAIGPTKKGPFCITFGSPLIGDQNLQEAVSRSSTWNSCFLHLAYYKDPLPRFFISHSNYMPVGTFLLCSEYGGSYFENPESTLEVLHMMDSYIGNVNQGFQGDFYGEIVENLKRKAICKEFTAWVDNMIYSICLKEQMQNLQTLRWIERHKLLLDYVTRVIELILRGNENLLNCIPSNMMHIFQHLRKLNVEECDSVVEIFESEGVDADNKEHGIMPYQLEIMCLRSLPELASIWRSHHASILGFQNLKTLEIKSCNSLKSVFPLSIAKSLPYLCMLEVSNCEMIEEIVAFKTDEGDKISQEPNEMAFPLLKELVLEDLPSLKRFCAGPCDVELPECRKITIKNCRKMESFFHAITFTPKLYSLSIEGTGYLHPLEEGLDAIIQGHHERKN